MVVAVALGLQGTLTGPADGLHRVKSLGTRPKPSPEQRIANLQERFEFALNDLTLTHLREVHGKDANGKPITMKVKDFAFGVNRFPSVLIEHNGVLRDSRIPAFRTQIEFYAVSCGGKPINAATLALHTRLGIYAMTASESTKRKVVSFAAKSVKYLSSAKVYRGRVDGCEAQARALKLTKPECLSCHPGMKVGDPAGYVVYLVRPTGKSG